MGKQIAVKQEETFDIVGLDLLDDDGCGSTIGGTELLLNQPRNQLSIAGKLFTFKHADGTTTNGGVGPLEIIILNPSKFQNKTYFEGAYDPKNPSKVACSSANGEAPDSWIEHPQATNCKICPKSQPKSGQNGQGKACKDSLAIAVLTEKFQNIPFLLVLPVTSIMSFRDYVTGLTKKLKLAGKLKDGEIAPFEVFLTELSYQTHDSDGNPLSYPELQFKEKSIIAKDRWAQIRHLAKSDEVLKLIRNDDESLAQHKSAIAKPQDVKEQPQMVTNTVTAAVVESPSPLDKEVPPAAAAVSPQAELSEAAKEAKKILEDTLAEVNDGFPV